MAYLDGKLDRLRSTVRSVRSAAVAFSGGADSALVAKVAHDELGDDAIAVTVDSILMPREELRLAKKVAKQIGIRHVIVPLDPLAYPGFERNPTDRCYICKLATFGEVRGVAGEMEMMHVLDGSNLDDERAFRPGSMARNELGVRSPLSEAGIGKDDVFRISKKVGLTTHSKAPSPCLATRVPYGERLTPELLARIEAAERYLIRSGFRDVRVRVHGDTARIEVSQDQIRAIAQDPKRKAVVRRLKGLGFTYVTIDLEGYRTGSMDEVIVR